MKAVEKLKAKLPITLKPLAEIAYNYWWSWTPERISLFRNIDPETWQKCNHNPVALLRFADQVRLSQLANDPIYIKRVTSVFKQFQRYMSEADTWASRVAPQISPTSPVAYFCAEFGIHESLPIYSGGLGILAGDHLKSASDLGVPLVAVGLMYRQGYFRQRINRHGWQEDYYVDNNFELMPLELMVNSQGHPITVEVEIRQRLVKIQIWRAQVGRVNLYLLDTDREDNDLVDRWLTGHLYGGNAETRIAQNRESRTWVFRMKGKRLIR